MPTLRGRVLLLLLVSASGPALPAQPAHFETRLEWSRTPVTNAVLDGRLADAARQYRAMAPLPRIAMYDLAYPQDSAEAVRLNGFGVLVITAVTQDSAELPLARVYLRARGGETQLVGLTALRSRVDPVKSDVHITFGVNRFDALLLVPLSALGDSGADLMIDFLVNRREFRIGVLGEDGPPPELRSFRPPVDATVPNMLVVAEVARREFPGIAEGLLRLTSPR